MGNTEQCRYLAAAYPDLNAHDTCNDHRHEQRVFDLAHAFACMFQNITPTDEQIGWFVDDADAVVDDFPADTSRWVIENHRAMPQELHGITNVFDVNGTTYVLQDSEWEPSHPVKLATYLEWTS